MPCSLDLSFMLTLLCSYPPATDYKLHQQLGRCAVQRSDASEARACKDFYRFVLTLLDGGFGIKSNLLGLTWLLLTAFVPPPSANLKDFAKALDRLLTTHPEDHKRGTAAFPCTIVILRLDRLVFKLISASCFHLARTTTIQRRPVRKRVEGAT